MIWLAAALAQEALPIGVETYRPSADATRALATDDASLPEAWSARAELAYQYAPLVWFSDSGERVAIVRDALAVQVAVAGAVGPVRIGVLAPIYPWVTSDRFGTRAALGDLTLDVKGVVRPSRPDGIGVALSGALDVPLGGSIAQFGAASPAVRFGGVVDGASGVGFGAANAGVHLTRPQDAQNARIGSHVYARGALGLQPHADWAIGLEAIARAGLLRAEDPTLPVELLLGAHHQRRGVAPYAAVGAGLTRSIGAPALRVVAGVRIRPSLPGPEGRANADRFTPLQETP